MDNPKIDVERIVGGAMKMRESTDAIVKLERENATSKAHLVSINHLGEVIDKQNEMVGFLLEQIINLGELMDRIYDHIDGTIKEN